MKALKSVYYFKATLDIEFDEKINEKPYRIIITLSSQSLSTLAQAIVKSFGFYFDHCYGFYDNFKNPYDSSEMYELFTDIGEEPTEGAQGVTYLRVSKAFDRVGKKLRFLFDYGDGWMFTVELVDIKPAEEKTKYPTILKRVGPAPEQYPPSEEEEEEHEHGN